MEEFILDHWSGDFGDHSDTFIREEDIDNSATMRIIRGEFRNPLFSDSDDTPRNNKINWDEIFNKKNKGRKKKNKVPKKKSAKAKKPRPKEQEASTEQLMPDVERVYEAEFKVKAQRMQALPKHYEQAAQITLESGSNNCHAELKQELIRVTLADLPLLQIPVTIEKQFNIIKPCTVPEPCQKHPYQIVLPNENALSTLPITKIHRELARFAVQNETHYIASENALKCLTQWSRPWLFPLSVCDTIGLDGDIVKVLVLDSEFSVHKEAAPMRTYRAFRHLLGQALKPSLERERIWEARRKPTAQNVDTGSDDEDNKLVIDKAAGVELAAKFANLNISPNLVYVFGSPNGEPGSPKAKSGSPKAEIGSPKLDFMVPNASFVPQNAGFVSPVSSFQLPSTRFGVPQAEQSMRGKTEGSLRRPAHLSGQESTSSPTGAISKKTSAEGIEVPDIELNSCTCADTSCGKLPRRSFRKWQFRKEGSTERHDIIVHCSHKGKDVTGELLLEPLPEYQSDVRASEQSSDAVRRAALSLTLRKTASLLNVRVDGPTGDVVAFEKLSAKAFAKRHPDVKRQVINTVLTVLTQLQDLEPGHYLLQHEASHGPNAMIMSPRSSKKRHTLHLNFDSDQLIEVVKARVPKLSPKTALMRIFTSDA